MILSVGTDHDGFRLKAALVAQLTKPGQAGFHPDEDITINLSEK